MKINLKILWLFIVLGLLMVIMEVLIDHVLLVDLRMSVPFGGEVSVSEMFMRVLLFLSFCVLGGIVAKLFYQAEQSRMKREEEAFFLQQLLNAIPAPLFYKDRNFKYLGGNSSFEDFSGREWSDIVGKTVYQIAPKHLADEYHSKDLELMEKPGTQVYESRVMKPDGQELHVMFHKATYFDLHGDLDGMIGVILDITELRKAEAEKESTIEDLQKALTEVKTLSGLIPICASCKNIRDDSGFWQKLERYLLTHSSAEFSHSICPECSDKLFADYEKEQDSQPD